MACRTHLSEAPFNRVRLSFLLNDDSTEINESLRDEYKRQYLSKKSKEQELMKKRDQFLLLQKQFSNIGGFK